MLANNSFNEHCRGKKNGYEFNVLNMECQKSILNIVNSQLFGIVEENKMVGKS